MNKNWHQTAEKQLVVWRWWISGCNERSPLMQCLRRHVLHGEHGHIDWLAWPHARNVYLSREWIYISRHMGYVWYLSCPKTQHSSNLVQEHVCSTRAKEPTSSRDTPTQQIRTSNYILSSSWRHKNSKIGMVEPRYMTLLSFQSQGVAFTGQARNL